MQFHSREDRAINIFEVSVAVHLVDKVSKGLGAIGLGFARTETAAAALQKRMDKIHSTWKSGLTMMAGGAALAAPLVAATHAAEKYAHQLNQMRSAGLSNKEMADATTSAWQTASKVMTSTATENLAVIMDLRSVFGSTQEAIAYAPTFARIQGAYASVLDGKLSHRSDELTFAMAKALDMVGKVKDPAQFNAAANAMFRATEASGGRVTATDYQTFFKYARQAKFGLNDHFLYKILPELLLENKGGGNGASGGVGPQVAALYRFGIQGTMNKRAAELAVQMGLVPAGHILKTTTSGTTLAGPLANADTLRANPFQWVQDTLVPALAKRFHVGLNDSKGLVEASNQFFKGNQLAANISAEMIMKRQQYQRFAGLYEKTDNIQQAFDRGMKNDPAANFKALHAAMDNLLTAFGKHVVPILVPAINKLATAIQYAAKFANEHPKITQAASGLLALGAGALMVGGALKILNAGWMGLKLVLGPVGSMVTKFAPALLGALGPEVVLPIVVAVGALAAVMANWDKITKFVHEHWKFFIHIAAMAEKQIKKLGLALQGLVNQIGHILEVLGAYIGAFGEKFQNSLLGGILGKMAGGAGDAITDAQKSALIAMKQAQNRALRAMHVDAATAAADEKYLRGQGLGALVDVAKGAGSRGGQPTAINQIGPFNMTVHAKDGQSGKELARDLGKELGHHIAKGISRASTAASRAGGVHKSQYAFGAGS